MEWTKETLDSLKAMTSRKAVEQALNLGMIVTTALMMWQMMMFLTGSESPVVVVLSGSMEPGFKRGDILFLRMSEDPIRSGDIVVFNIKGRDIPNVHRAIEVHERQDTGETYILTKGDNNPKDDRSLYAPGQAYLKRQHIMGRAVGVLPHVGWATIIMTEKPLVKLARLIGLSPPPKNQIEGGESEKGRSAK